MGVVLGIITICAIVYFIADAQEKESIYTINGKKYRMECIGMNRTLWARDMRLRDLGELSQDEYNRRMKKNYYAAYAYVEIGQSVHSWKEDPVNKEIFLRIHGDKLSEHEPLPKYLQEESGCFTVKGYKDKMGME